MTESQAALRARLTDLLRGRYTRTPKWMATAPGRVNLIGDHTDYAGGLAMPMAIDLVTIALAAPAVTGSDQLRIYSCDFGECSFTARSRAKRAGDWSDYLRGVHAGFLRCGANIPALDVVIASSVPPGAGLSSSASLELCFAILLEQVCKMPMAPEQRALLCQQAEHDYARVPCGILDQFAISFAQPGHALILDCRNQTVKPVPVPDDLRIAVVDSGLRHDLSDGSYAQRRADVKAAEVLLGQSLRDCSLADLARLSDPVLAARARHVVSENQRVTDFARALTCAQHSDAGALMYASHRSLAEDFAVSCAAMDDLVQAAREAGALGARMTGGGFGGSMVCLVEQRSASDFATRLRNLRAAQNTALRWVRAGAGAHAELLA
jgi:galactokinase